MTKHRCTLGTYMHSSSEIQLFQTASEIDGLGIIELWFNFCPDCGKKITAKMKKDVFNETR